VTTPTTAETFYRFCVIFVYKPDAHTLFLTNFLALVGVVTNKPPYIQAVPTFTVIKVVGDNTNNGRKISKRALAQTPFSERPK
jgi:hypothetical protein